MKNNKINTTNYTIKIYTSALSQATKQQEEQSNQVKPLKEAKSNQTNNNQECLEIVNQLNSSSQPDVQTLQRLQNLVQKQSIPKDTQIEILNCMQNLVGGEPITKKNKLKSSIIDKVAILIKKHGDEAQTIAQITNGYNQNLKLSTAAKKYIAAFALTGVREYHLNKLSEEHQNVFFAPHTLHYLNNNEEFKASFRSDLLLDRKKYPFALGDAFGEICSYLSNQKITLLLSTNKVLRNSVKIYKNNMALNECQNLVNQAIANRKEFIDLFITQQFNKAILLLHSNELVAYNDINADEPNLLNIITNSPKVFNELTAYRWYPDVALMFHLIMQKGGMQDIQIDGSNNLLKSFSFADFLKIIKSKPVSLIKIYQANPGNFNLNAPDQLGETILLEALSDGNPNQDRVKLVLSIIEAGADLNKANSITDEKPLERLIKTITMHDQVESTEQAELLEYIIRKLASDPNALKKSIQESSKSIVDASHNFSSKTLKMFCDAGLDVSLRMTIDAIADGKTLATNAQEDLVEWIIKKSEPSSLKNTFNSIPDESLTRYSHNPQMSDKIVGMLLDVGLYENYPLGLHKLNIHTFVNGGIIRCWLEQLDIFVNGDSLYYWTKRPQTSQFLIDKMPYTTDSPSIMSMSVNKLSGPLIFSRVDKTKLGLSNKDFWVDYFIEKLQSKPEAVKCFIKDHLYDITHEFNNLDKKIVTFLVDKDLDLTQVLMLAIENRVFKNGDKILSALDITAVRNIKSIIESGADVNIADKKGVTPLLALINKVLVNNDPRQNTYEIHIQIISIIKLLIKNGADVNTTYENINPISMLNKELYLRSWQLTFCQQIKGIFIKNGAEEVDKKVTISPFISGLQDFKKAYEEASKPTNATKKREEKANNKEKELLDKCENKIDNNIKPDQREDSQAEKVESVLINTAPEHINDNHNIVPNEAYPHDVEISGNDAASS